MLLANSLVALVPTQSIAQMECIQSQREGDPFLYVICSSTALRAQQTARTIFKVLSEKNRCELDTNYDGLCELGQGRWEGFPKDAEYQKELKKWEERSAYDKVMYPKAISGESYQDVTARYLPDLQTIVQKHLGKIILIVLHYSAMNAMNLS